MTWLLLSILITLSGHSVLKPGEVYLIFNNTEIHATTGRVDWLIRHVKSSRRFVNLILYMNRDRDNIYNTNLILHEIGHFLCIKDKDWSEKCANDRWWIMEDSYFYPYYKNL